MAFWPWLLTVDVEADGEKCFVTHGWWLIYILPFFVVLLYAMQVVTVPFLFHQANVIGNET